MKFPHWSFSRKVVKRHECWFDYMLFWCCGIVKELPITWNTTHHSFWENKIIFDVGQLPESFYLLYKWLANHGFWVQEKWWHQWHYRYTWLRLIKHMSKRFFSPAGKLYCCLKQCGSITCLVINILFFGVIFKMGKKIKTRSISNFYIFKDLLSLIYRLFRWSLFMIIWLFMPCFHCLFYQPTSCFLE